MQYSNAVPSTPHSCLTSLRLTRCSHASTLLPPNTGPLWIFSFVNSLS